ncbi:MAG: thioredoxin family protein [Flavobacteriaceae bacterium]|nr:thioredoxin family protein [Flavobacteriaceae bacterium]
MAKFGDLINSSYPTLIDFHSKNTKENSILQNTLYDVAVALGDKAKVIKIDIAKNEKLVNALRIKGNPTFMIYKKGEMKWRQSGEQDANTLINLVKQFV